MIFLCALCERLGVFAVKKRQESLKEGTMDLRFFQPFRIL
jgi:hypothetical protein